MKNNRTTFGAILKDDITTVQAKRRLWKRYGELRQSGGYRALADEVGMNQMYVWEFMTHGMLPSNEELKELLLNWRPAESRKELKPMDKMMQKLHDTIKFEHVGAEKGIKKKELLRKLYGESAAADESYNNVQDRQLRKMIESLNHDHGALICSSPKCGYFWPSTLSEGLQTVERLEKRARKQLSNTGHLERNLKLVFGGQADLSGRPVSG